ncbi:hypothetical protein FN846DRAFT_904228 [Sphaerosporella brunnea]|uniref:Uncharacterized protein n=1 Tax=Sphaerosporella brunnea TaxID=1250544 RepID=A0A5J5F544_9PEZI|nr:hypothetical protein FN846DRAFT_904228 [Sphaerosporella brunnea]
MSVPIYTSTMLGLNIISKAPTAMPQLLLVLGSIGVFTTVWASIRQTVQNQRDELERRQSEEEFQEKYDSGKPSVHPMHGQVEICIVIEGRYSHDRLTVDLPQF